jgi:putative SOS response-associated peptidase YedK
MPLILKPESYEQWLDPENKDAGRIEEVMKNGCVKDLKRYPLSKLVNKVGNNSKECIETTDIPKKNLLGAGAT